MAIVQRSSIACRSVLVQSRCSSILAALRADMKTAMRAKESDRLATLRGVLADINNAAKTDSPIDTDSQLVTLLRKQIVAAEAAASQATEAQRIDLQDKELSRMKILRAYLEHVQSTSDEEVREAALHVVHALKVENRRCDQGAIMKRLVGAEGLLKGKIVDNRQVSTIVGSLL